MIRCAIDIVKRGRSIYMDPRGYFGHHGVETNDVRSVTMYKALTRTALEGGAALQLWPVAVGNSTAFNGKYILSVLEYCGKRVDPT